MSYTLKFVCLIKKKKKENTFENKFILTYAVTR